MSVMTLVRRVIRFLRRFDKIFFDGPAIYNYPGRAIDGYRSVNVMVAHWIRAFGVSRFTPAGRILILATAYFLLGGMLTLLMPIYLLSITLLCLFLVDIAIGWWLRPSLEIRRIMPESASANVPIQLDYTIKNRSSRPALDVFVDTVPFQSAVTLVRDRAFISALKPNETETVANEIRIHRRGQFMLPLPVADTSFPFGLWRWGSHGPANRPILVYPDYTPLAALSLPHAHSDHSAGHMAYSSSAGQAMEFLGCREFRYGDNPRHIHSRSWARLAQPVVKEFSDEHTQHCLVYIDTFTHQQSYLRRLFKKPNPQFEACLSLAAATLDYLDRHDYRIDLFTAGRDGIHIAGLPGSTQLEEMLTGLAAVDDRSGDAFDESEVRLGCDIGAMTCVVVFMLDMDAARLRFMRTLEETGVSLRGICVSDHALPTGLPDYITHVTPVDIVGGTVTSL